jgi:hypothetical protein
MILDLFLSEIGKRKDGGGKKRDEPAISNFI